jgi:hypothetical protein
MWDGLGLLAAAVLGLAGCTTDNLVKLRKHPDEYNVPPADDLRYSQPPQYAKELLNRDVIVKPEKDGQGPGGPQGGPGGSPSSAGRFGGGSRY